MMQHPTPSRCGREPRPGPLVLALLGLVLAGGASAQDEGREEVSGAGDRTEIDAVPMPRTELDAGPLDEVDNARPLDEVPDAGQRSEKLDAGGRDEVP